MCREVGVDVARAEAHRLAAAVSRRLLAVQVLAIEDPVAHRHGRQLPPHRDQHQHLRRAAEARHQPPHQRRHLVLAQVVEHVPGQDGVEALVRGERQQPLDERRHRLRPPRLDGLGGQRAVEVGDADAGS